MKLDYDNPFMQVGTKVANLLIVNLYWWLGCLPLVTIGSSTIAAYTVLLKMAEDNEPMGVTRLFWRAWKSNLKHGIALTLILAVAAYSIWIDWQLFEKLEGNPIAFLILAMILVFVVLMHYLFVFPLEARYENTLLQHLANARRICVRFFLQSLAIGGILVLQVLLFFFVNPALTYIWIFVGPALMFFTVSQFAMPVFRTLEKNSMASDGFKVGSREDHDFNGIS